MEKFSLRRLMENTYLGVMLIFFYAPIAVLMAFSFSSEKSRASWGHFTLNWYGELFGNPEILAALRTTLLVALISAVLATVIGTVSAIGIYGYRKGTRTLIMNLTYLPIINPDIVTGISLMILFVFMKMELGFFTMLLAHMAFNIPYVIYSVWPKLNQMDKSIYEAALDLGATPGYALRQVILPQIAPGVITGFILAITLSIDDFVISFFTSSGVQNLSIYIYSAARRGIDPTLYALMTLMFVVILSLLSVVNYRTGKTAGKAEQKGDR